MTRIWLLTAPMALLAACASAPAAKPPTTTELLMGAWTCETKADALTMKTAPITYLPGGKSTFHVVGSGSAGAMAFEVVGDGEGTWQLLPGDKGADGKPGPEKLEDKITSVNVVSAKMNGQDIPPAMVQGLSGQLVNQSSVGTIVVTKTAMTQTTPDGHVTSCTR